MEKPGTNKSDSPSSNPEGLLRLLTRNTAHGPYILGDLREEFRDISDRRGRLLAVLWYWVQVLGIGIPAAVRAVVRNRGGKAEQILQDIGFCLRTLRKRPLFTVISVGTLGLGIGAMTTMYSVVHTILRNDLPYRNADRLVSIWQTSRNTEEGGDESGNRWGRIQLTYPQFNRLSEGSRSFENVAAFHRGPSMILTGGDQPLRVGVGVASASLFSVLGLEPAVGRSFQLGEAAGTPGQAANVAVLDHGFWMSRFGGERDVIGKSLMLDGRTFHVVGVLGPRFRLRSRDEPGSGKGRANLWIPIGQPGRGLNDSALDWEVVGRLAPGVTLEEAEAEAKVLLAGVYQGSETEIRVVPRAADESLTLDPRTALMTGGAGILLLIVFLNVAILFLGEFHGRRQEIATRVALGAGRSRIFRQLMTEGAVLGLMGSGLGILSAVAGTRALVALAPPIPRIDELAVESPALLCAILLGLVGAIVVGTLPVFSQSEGVRSASITTAANRTTTGRSELFQSGLVASEMALTVLLLVFGGLLTRSLIKLQAVDTGFRAQKVATVRVSLPASAQDPEEFFAFARSVVREMESDPEVIRASAAGGLPFGAGMIGGDGLTLGAGDPESPDQAFARRIHVLPEFHETLGIPLLAGRGITYSDGPETPAVMVVSESFAQRSWPNRSAVGETVRHWGEPRTVVGIVGDVKLEELGMDHESSFYVPLAQIPRSEVDFVAQTTGDPARVLHRMRQAVWAIRSDLPVTRTSTLARLVADSAAAERFRAFFMVAFAGAAAILAAGGVFGVTARSVALRRREMGVRLALGAQKTAVMGLVIGGSLRSALIGTALGLTGALAVSQLLSGFLFGVRAWDPLTYVGVALWVTVTCVVASFAPARVATDVDPLEALRV